MPAKIAFPVERIEKAILLIRCHKVLLDQDLTSLYGITTKPLNQQVRRTITRFPNEAATPKQRQIEFRTEGKK